MAELRIEEDEVLVSFDLSSLFTNIPVTEAIQVIRNRLQQDGMLADRTTLTPDRVPELLETCLKSTYFSYRESSSNNWKEQQWTHLSLLWWQICTWSSLRN